MAMVYHGYQPWLHGVPMVTPVRALHLGYTTHQTSGEGVQLTSLSVYLHLVFVFVKNTRPSLWGRSPACFLCLHLTGICICTEMAGFAFVGNLIPLVRACCTLGWQSVMNIHNLLKSKLKMLMMVGGVNGAWLRKEQLDRAMGCLFSWERRPMESSETPRTKGSKSV